MEGLPAALSAVRRGLRWRLLDASAGAGVVAPCRPLPQPKSNRRKEVRINSYCHGGAGDKVDYSQVIKVLTGVVSRCFCETNALNHISADG